MTKADQLNKLFSKWVNDIPEYKSKLIKDGIINESLYSEAKKKILFIMKEANDPEQSEWTFQDLWKDGVKYRFSFRLADWAYGIINDFPDYCKVRSNRDNIDTAIRSIALINIKKSGGGGSSNNEEIMKHCERNHKYIYKEIEIIDPEFIILGTWSSKIRESLFSNVDWIELKHDVLIGRWGKRIIIDFYHASTRKKNLWLYNLLHLTFISKEFQSL